MFYKPRSTIGIKDNDEKISILGKISEIFDGGFILEDDVGEVKIKSELKVSKGEIVRIFCKRENGELIAEIIQNLRGLDLDSYRKVETLFKNL